MTRLLKLPPAKGHRSGAARHIAVLSLTAVILSGCNSLPNKSPADYGQPKEIADHIYIGAGLGLSRLTPDATRSSQFDVNDRVHNAGLLNAGIDLSRQLSLDFQAANLGSAGFSPGGSIDYKEYSASALFYLGKNRHNWKRRGLTAFGRIGGGYLDNDTNGVPFEQVNGFHFLFGGGAEYMTRSGFGIRAEAISYEKDILLGQLGLIYRFGRGQQRDPIPVVKAPVPVVKKPEPVIQAALPEPDHCEALSGSIDGLTFQTDSAKLSERSSAILAGVATRLTRCDDFKITVSAHADSIGSEAYNEALSQRRADSVVSFFNQRGVDAKRLDPIAYGETSPIDSNDTREGRAKNRRVELLIEN